MNIKEASQRMKKSEQFIRIGLQRGTLPFGSAVKVSDKRWSYHISEGQFRAYMGE